MRFGHPFGVTVLLLFRVVVVTSSLRFAFCVMVSTTLLFLSALRTDFFELAGMFSERHGVFCCCFGLL